MAAYTFYNNSNQNATTIEQISIKNTKKSFPIDSFKYKIGKLYEKCEVWSIETRPRRVS